MLLSGLASIQLARSVAQDLGINCCQDLVALLLVAVSCVWEFKREGSCLGSSHGNCRPNTALVDTAKTGAKGALIRSLSSTLSENGNKQTKAQRVQFANLMQCKVGGRLPSPPANSHGPTPLSV